MPRAVYLEDNFMKNYVIFMGLRFAALSGATLRGSLALGPAASGGSSR
jgi:hypothetical protein